MKNTLKKTEILKGWSTFQDVFNDCSVIRKGDIRVYYKISDSEDANPIKVGFTVTKQIRKKIYRNRIKRLLREFFRLNKEELLLKLLTYKKCIKFIIHFNGNDTDKIKRINYTIIENSLINIFGELIKKIQTDI